MGVIKFHEFFSSQNLLPYNYFGDSACSAICYHEKRERLVLLIKVELPIRLKLIINFS